MLKLPRVCWQAFVVGIAVVGATATAPAADPSAQEIMSRVLEINAGVNDYTAKVNMQADIEVAPSNVPEYKVYFKRPDKVHIESRSIVVARREMFTFGSLAKRVDEGTTPHLLGKKIENGVPVYTVKLVPQQDADIHPERVILRVDGQRWTVNTIEITDGQKTMAKFHWAFTQVGGKYWMPSTIRCELPDVPSRDGTSGAEISVAFSDYTVNTGLSDDIFTDDE